MEDIRNDIWADPDFEVLDGTAKLVYIWSWTNPRCDMAGVYTVSVRAIGVECAYDENTIEEALGRLATARFISYVDGWLWVRTRVKHLRQKGAPMATSVVRDLDRLPAWHPLRAAFVNEYAGELSKGRPWLQDALAEAGIGNPSGTPLGTQSSALESQKGNPPRTPTGVVKDRDRVTGSITSSQGKDEVDARARTRAVDQDSLPATLPETLKPVADEVLAVLLRAHSERGGSKPTLRGVGLLLASIPDRDHKSVADELEYWATSGGGQKRNVVDWVATLRSFLRRSPVASPTRPSQAPQSRPKQSYSHLEKRG